MTYFDPGVVAQYGGLCPLCSRFIAAGRSRVTPLPVSVPPVVGITCGAGTDPRPGWRLNGDVIRVTARTWTHVHCRQQAERDPAFLGWESVAEEHRAVLAERKRVALARAGVGRPRKQAR